VAASGHLDAALTGCGVSNGALTCAYTPVDVANVAAGASLHVQLEAGYDADYACVNPKRARPSAIASGTCTGSVRERHTRFVACERLVTGDGEVMTPIDTLFEQS
jgi:hypothetical protein